MPFIIFQICMEFDRKTPVFCIRSVEVLQGPMHFYECTIFQHSTKLSHKTTGRMRLNPLMTANCLLTTGSADPQSATTSVGIAALKGVSRSLCSLV